MSLDDNLTDTAAAIEAGRESIDIERRTAVFDVKDLDAGKLPIRLRSDSDGGIDVLVAEDVLRVSDERAAAPRRRKGTHKVDELDSFIRFVNRCREVHSTLWAEVASLRITAVFNDGASGVPDPGWRDYRAVYTCPLSPEWVLWKQCEGALMKQDKFGDFIESRLEDLSVAEGMPKPNEILKMARDLQIVTKGVYSRTFDPTTGNGSLVCKTESEAVQSTVIPRAFLVAIPVFQGGDRYAVEARVRMQVVDGAPTFRYELHRRIEVEGHAFDEIRKAVAEKTGLPLFAGTP